MYSNCPICVGGFLMAKDLENHLNFYKHKRKRKATLKRLKLPKKNSPSNSENTIANLPFVAKNKRYVYPQAVPNEATVFKPQGDNEKALPQKDLNLASRVERSSQQKNDLLVPISASASCAKTKTRKKNTSCDAPSVISMPESKKDIKKTVSLSYAQSPSSLNVNILAALKSKSTLHRAPALSSLNVNPDSITEIPEEGNINQYHTSPPSATVAKILDDSDTNFNQDVSPQTSVGKVQSDQKPSQISFLSKTVRYHKCEHCSTKFVDITKLMSHMMTHVQEVKKKVQNAQTFIIASKPEQTQYHEDEDVKGIRQVKPIEITPHQDSQLEIKVEDEAQPEIISHSLKALIPIGTKVSDVKKIECNICKRHIHPYQYERHLRNHQNNAIDVNGLQAQDFPCNKCEKILKSKRSLEYHIKCYHSFDNPKTCHICQKVYYNLANYNAHMNVHLKRSMYIKKRHQCHICGRIMCDAKSLRYHLDKHAGKKEYECKICHKFFRTPPAIRCHMYSHNIGKKNHVCDLCGKAFSIPYELKNHRANHGNAKKKEENKKATTEGLLECDYCDRVFHHAANLARHRSIHKNEKHHD